MEQKHFYPHSFQEALDPYRLKEALSPFSKLESAFHMLEFKSPLGEIQDTLDQLRKSFGLFESPLNALQALDPFQVQLKQLL